MATNISSITSGYKYYDINDCVAEYGKLTLPTGLTNADIKDSWIEWEQSGSYTITRWCGEEYMEGGNYMGLWSSSSSWNANSYPVDKTANYISKQFYTPIRCVIIAY